MRFKISNFKPKEVLILRMRVDRANQIKFGPFVKISILRFLLHLWGWLRVSPKIFQIFLPPCWETAERLPNQINVWHLCKLWEYWDYCYCREHSGKKNSWKYSGCRSYGRYLVGGGRSRARDSGNWEDPTESRSYNIQSVSVCDSGPTNPETRFFLFGNS